ncbi:MAG: nuclease-related domain-containing protein [Desulfobulbaceae bacterium]|nr:nuclease-related domain-containing protein [Desulfobulbaceae bacterium]
MKTIATLIYIFLPTAIFFTLVYCTGFLLDAWKKISRMGKRSPLKGYKFWRSPGESLRKKINDYVNEILAFMALIPISIFLYSPYYYSQFFAFTKGESIGFNFYLALTLNGFLIAYSIWRIIRTWSIKHDYVLGLDGETYVGQQLNHLMLLGCRIYHDFQTAKQGNIDHIVVSPAGVFAVETKGRYKPDKKRGKADAKVIYDGKVLKFSDVIQTDQPLTQAKELAKTLAQELSSSIGKNVQVTPVVALPGWWVDLKASPSDVKLFNGKLVEDTGQFDAEKIKRNFFFQANHGNEFLSQDLFKAIVHRLDEKCRNVEPKAYTI